jgi:hypothetical protein
MHGSRKTARLSIVLGALFLAAGNGCGGGSSTSPDDQAARAALDAALTAWSRGSKPGVVPGSEPPVVVHDTPWSQGQRLASYEVLGEEEGAAAAEKQFIVRLSLSKPDRDEEVKYHVLGISPLMVFRDQDYLRNINMENGPRPLRTGGRARRPR